MVIKPTTATTKVGRASARVCRLNCKLGDAAGCWLEGERHPFFSLTLSDSRHDPNTIRWNVKTSRCCHQQLSIHIYIYCVKEGSSAEEGSMVVMVLMGCFLTRRKPPPRPPAHHQSCERVCGFQWLFKSPLVVVAYCFHTPCTMQRAKCAGDFWGGWRIIFSAKYIY